MSRILIVTEQLNSPVIISHIESIKNLGHEATVVTSKNQKNYVIDNMETLYFFSKWNFKEWFQFFPVFFSVRPQLVHFLIESNAKLTAQNLLLEICHALGIPIFTHFLNLTYINQKSKNLTLYVYKSDLITCAHRQSLMGLRGLNTRNKKQIRGLIPPVLSMDSGKKHAYREAISIENLTYFLERNQNILLIPFKSEIFNLSNSYGKILLKTLEYNPVIFVGPVDELSIHEKKAIDSQLVLANSRNKHEWTYFSAKSFSGSLSLFPAHSKILISGLPLTIQEVSEIFEQTILNKQILIMDEFQAELYSGLWQDKVNCFVVTNYQTVKSLDHLFRAPYLDSFDINSINTDVIKSEIMDAPINEFNRLLNKVLSLNYEKR